MKLAYEVDFTAVVTFGAPPVAENQEFCELYTKCVGVSWRIENGVELGPLLPPLPFTSSTVFQHVGRKVRLQSLFQDSVSAKATAADLNDRDTDNYSLDYLDEIAETEQLPCLFLDHNPFEALRNLQSATTILHNRQSHDLWTEKMHGIEKETTTDEEGRLTDTDSEKFYSAYGSTPKEYY
jgi:hypothetical protein